MRALQHSDSGLPQESAQDLSALSLGAAVTITMMTAGSLKKRRVFRYSAEKRSQDIR